MRQFGSHNQSERHAPGQSNLTYHFFHSIAVHDRIQTSHLDDTKLQYLISTLGVSDFIPSLSDYQQLRSDLIVLIARIVVAEFPELRFMLSAVPTIFHTSTHQKWPKSPQWYVFMFHNENLLIGCHHQSSIEYWCMSMLKLHH